MIGFYSAGAMGGGGPSPVASLVGADGANFIATGTSINSPSTPPGIQDGDAVYAFIYSRSTLTPPSGWTLIDSQSNSNPDTSANQTLHVYRKETVTSGDSSTAYTWNQSASGRMGLAYVVVRSDSGAIVEAEVKKAAQNFTSASSFNVLVPHVVAETHGELVLVAASAITASTTLPDTWAAPSGATMTTTATQEQNRLAVAHHARNRGQGNTTPMTLTAATGPFTNHTMVIVLRVRPADAMPGPLPALALNSNNAVTVEP